MLPGRRTPWVSILFTTLIAFGLIGYVVRASGSSAGASTVALLGALTSAFLVGPWARSEGQQAQ